ncbi:MAG: ATP-binding protein, partial [Chloroflexi bacterium]
MRVLLIGVGTVGEAIARMAATREWCDALVLADYDLARARGLEGELGSSPVRISVEGIDAREAGAVADLARRHQADLVMNAVDP